MYALKFGNSLHFNSSQWLFEFTTSSYSYATCIWIKTNQLISQRNVIWTAKDKYLLSSSVQRRIHKCCVVNIWIDSNHLRKLWFTVHDLVLELHIRSLRLLWLSQKCSMNINLLLMTLKNIILTACPIRENWW